VPASATVEPHILLKAGTAGRVIFRNIPDIPDIPEMNYAGTIPEYSGGEYGPGPALGLADLASSFGGYNCYSTGGS
jgi:hypothetical protein